MKVLNKKDLISIEGGLNPIAYFAFAYLWDVATNLEEHVQAFKEGYNSVKNK